jgi:segregation and condensation protein B
MNQEQLKNIIEAALMVSDKPMSINRLLELFQKDVEEIEREEIMAAIQELQDDYQTRGIELAKVANGYRIQSRAEYADWVNRLFDEKPPRYSRALLETLAIIAYRQPLTRAEIEDIRGVSVSSNIIKTLQEREWIRVVGHKDLPGKPELLATTKEFLDYFNLKTLSELPTLAEIKELNQLNPDLFASLDSTPDFAAEGQPVTDIDESEDESDADDDGFLDEGKVVPFSNA